MELENHLNGLNIGNSNQEVYAQEDLSFEADQENLNTSTSSDRFETPSAKLIYEQQISNKKQPQNVRQTLFQNLDPLNESNTHNQQQNLSINHSLDNTNFSEKTIVNKNLDHNTCSLNISNDFNQSTYLNDQTTFLNETVNQTAFLSDDHNKTNYINNYAMDLSTKEINQKMNDNNYEELLKEKDELNNKLTNYVQQLNQLNKNLSEAILTVQDKFETNLNQKNAIIDELTLQNSVLAKEKKLATEDVQGLENSFSELHRRYEKLKLALESSKKNEEMYQDECLAYSEKLEESQRLNNDYKQRLDVLENEKMNIVESVKRESQKEIISLRAQLKKAEMRFNSLQSQLEQKTNENHELHSMIDDLTK